MLYVIKYFIKYYNTGFNINIKSNFEQSIGLGSSTALVISLIIAIMKFLKFKIKKNIIFNISLKIILKIQYKASGADIATSLYGGIIYYKYDKKINRYIYKKIKNFIFPINLIYTGYKIKTQYVLQYLKYKFYNNKVLLNKLYKNIGEIVEKSFYSLKNKKYKQFFINIKKNQLIMQKLGLCNILNIKKIIKYLKKQSNILGYKISGAGLGDCIVIFGTIMNSIYKVTSVKIEKCSIIYE